VRRELDALLFVAVLSLVAAAVFANQTDGTSQSKRRARRAAADRPRGPPPVGRAGVDHPVTPGFVLADPVASAPLGPVPYWTR
jgi:hypothetical protein